MPTPSPPKPSTPAAKPTAPSPVEVHVADVVIAQIAAYHARQVPGVVGLQPRLGANARISAERMLRASGTDPRLGELPLDGVHASSDDRTRTARIEVDVILRLGVSCLDVAQAIQQHVGAQVEVNTGLRSVVTVNVVDLELEDNTDPVGHAT